MVCSVVFLYLLFTSHCTVALTSPSSCVHTSFNNYIRPRTVMSYRSSRGEKPGLFSLFPFTQTIGRLYIDPVLVTHRQTTSLTFVSLYS